MSMELTRRNFLAGAATLGAGTAALFAGCSPKPQANGNASAAKNEEGNANAIETVSEDKIVETKEADVVVVGLGISGVAAMRSATEAGAKVVAVEKCKEPQGRSSGIAAFNTDNARALGVEDIDTAELANELMTQMSHRADYRVIKKWADHCGEAFDWYVGTYDGIVWVANEDEYPADENQVYVEHWSMSKPYVYGRDHEKTFDGCLNIGPGEHTPVLMANADAAIAAGAEAVFNSAAQYLETENGRVAGVVCKNLNDDTYFRVKANKGVILATGGYSHNEDMLKEYAPWVYENRDKYLFSYASTDAKGQFADTGDGQRMGIAAGGHVDVGPHAVMAHIGLFGGASFLMVNEKGERFCNEDLSSTNVSKVIVNQPGTKVFEICDSHYDEQVPGLLDTMALMRGNDDGFSAEADTIEGLGEKLGVDGKTLAATVARYNELIAAGKDADFGKAAEKGNLIVDAPFYAITYDTAEHTSADDVSNLRLLVTMGGLVTDDNARVLNDNGEPIEGLFAVGNTQGARFVEDYPFTLSGASHAAALTYGYLTGAFAAKQA